MRRSATVKRALACYGPILDRVVASGQVALSREPGSPSAGQARNILVASGRRRDGRTTTAMGLAVTAALLKPRKRILLADFDLRSSALSHTFGLADAGGIREVIATGNDPHFFSTTRLDNLSILAGGMEDVDLPEAFRETNLTGFLGRLRSRFDLAFFDSPPLNRYVDAKMLSELMDAVILVARSGRSRANELVAAKKALGGKVIGVVLNGRRQGVPSFLRRDF